MEIKLHEISVRDVFDGYYNDEESGQVVAYGGKLNVRPAYQREFVYDDKKKIAVMNSILHEFPLNVMYWSENEDGTYEMLDGQQRTISICDWLDNGYSIFANPASLTTPYYAHTSKEITEKVLDYKLMIYICKGTDTEKLDWFKIINIAGEKLTDQELRNAIYTGEWLSDAKKYFSKNQCIAYKIGEKYMSGSTIRQDYLQTVLGWVSTKENKTIEEILEWADKEVDRFALYFYADDLKFFKRSGRISNFSATMGTIIGIHPIIHVDDQGVMTTIAKERGRKKALNKVMEYVETLADDIYNHPVLIAHSDSLELAEKLRDMLVEKYGSELQIEFSVVNPTIGSHCGPNAIGVCFHAKHR